MLVDVLLDGLISASFIGGTFPSHVPHVLGVREYLAVVWCGSSGVLSH